jgi:hypothetical protein
MVSLAGGRQLPPNAVTGTPHSLADGPAGTPLRALTCRACSLHRLGPVVLRRAVSAHHKARRRCDALPSLHLFPGFPQWMLTRRRAEVQPGDQPKKPHHGTPGVLGLQRGASWPSLAGLIQRPAKRYWIQHLPSQRFRVLFTLFSEFYLTFPTRYFFAIGLPVIFSFRRSSPPI